MSRVNVEEWRSRLGIDSPMVNALTTASLVEAMRAALEGRDAIRVVSDRGLVLLGARDVAVTAPAGEAVTHYLAAAGEPGDAWSVAEMLASGRLRLAEGEEVVIDVDVALDASGGHRRERRTLKSRT